MRPATAPGVCVAAYFLGHGAERLTSVPEQAVHDFFMQDAPDRWRRDLLARYGIDYVYHGPREKALGPLRPAWRALPGLVYDRENVQLYRVMLALSPETREIKHRLVDSACIPCYNPT